MATIKSKQADRLGKDNMKASKGYNGYKNYAQWNQALWIDNDKGLYNLAKEAIQFTDSRTEAIEYILDTLNL